MTTDDGRQWLPEWARELTRRYLLVAAFVLVAGLALRYWRWSVTPRGTGWSVPSGDPVWLVAVVAVGLATVPGYLDDGLLAGWSLGTAPFIARALGPAVVPTMAFDQPILFVFATAVLLGAVAGSMGFVLGMGVRRVLAVDKSPSMSSL